MSEPEGIVEKSKEGNSDQVDDPTPQGGFEQFQPRPFIQDSQRSQSNKSRSYQYRPERESQFLVAIVDPGQTRLEKPTHTRGNNQQADQQCDREAEPGYGSALPCPPFRLTGFRSSGKSRDDPSLTPNAPSAPFST